MAKKVAVEIDIQGTKDVIELQKQIRQVNKELKTTEDAEAFNRLAADLVKLRAQLKEARKAQRQAVDAFTATDEGVGAYSRLSAELRVARNRLKDLQAAGTTTGEEVEQLTRTVNELDSTLKEIDRSVGQTNREIGAYEEAVRKAVGITDAQAGAFTRLQGKADVLKRTYRDVVAAQGANSEAAKKLKKELDAVEKQLKATGNQAEKTGKRIGGLRTQLRGLGPAAANLASGFLIFSELPQILGDVAEGLQTVANLISPSIALNNALNESINESIESYVDERLELEAVFNAAKDDNISREEKSAAINTINEQYGEYLPSLLTEKSTLEEIAAAQKIATAELIKNIAARAAREKLEEDIKRLAEAEAAAIAIEERAESTTGKIADGASRANFALLTLGATEFFGKGQEAQFSNLEKAINNVETQSAQAAINSNEEFQTRFTDRLFEIEDALASTFANAGQVGTEETAKAANKVREEALKQTQKLAQQQLKEQQKLLKQLGQENIKFAQLLNKLEQDTIKQTLQNAEEGLSRELKIEENANRVRIENLQATTKKFEDEAKARQERVNKAFGEGSKQALATQQSIAKQRIELNKATDEAIEAQTTASLKRRDEIRKTFEEKAAKERQEALKQRLTELQAEQNAIVAAAEQEQLKIRELRAKGQIDAQEADKQAFDSRVQALKDQIAQLNQQDIALISEQAAGAEVAQGEFDKIAAARQQLNTQLAELEEAQTKKVQEESKKREDAVLQSFQKAFEGFSQGLELVDGFSTALNERQIARLEAQKQERQQNIEGLQEELSEASGLEKAFLEQRVREETQAAQEIADQQERARKEQAIAQKALAIGQAIINGALAVTAVLAQTTDPTPVQAFRAAAVAATIATTAAQVATIAAQPLATGGIVGQNITGQPIKRSNGDDTLTTLKRGEVVLNKRQQARLGGARTFAAAGVPGFAGGGIFSPPMRPPTLAEAQTSSENVLMLIETNQKTIQELKNAVMRQEVVYTTETEEAIQRDKLDRKQITQRATL